MPSRRKSEATAVALYLHLSPFRLLICGSARKAYRSRIQFNDRPNHKQTIVTPTNSVASENWNQRRRGAEGDSVIGFSSMVNLAVRQRLLKLLDPGVSDSGYIEVQSNELR